MKRLACALRFLIETKIIEAEIYAAASEDGRFEGDMLTSTIASGSKTVDEFKEDREKILNRNKTRRVEDVLAKEREEELKEITATEKRERRANRKRNDDADPADQTMHTHYRVKRRNPKFPLVSEQHLSTPEDFKAYVPLEVRTKEDRAFDRQWRQWEEKHDDERKLRKKLDYIFNHDAFDPDPIVTEFEARSYSELIHFLFTRAADCDDGTDAMEKSKLKHKEIIFNQKLNEYFVQKMQKFILRLRSAETNPHPLRDFGHEFLYKIDNWLAVLLYRRRRISDKNVGPSYHAQNERQEALEKYLEEQAELEAQQAENSRLVYWQALVHQYIGEDAPTTMLQFGKVGVPVDQANRSYLRPTSVREQLRQSKQGKKEKPEGSSLRSKIEFLFYGLLLTAVVCVSVWGLYEIWKFTSTRSLEGVSDKLNAQIEQAVEKRFFARLEDVTTSARFSSTGLFDRGIDPSTFSQDRLTNQVTHKENIEAVERFLVESIQKSNVSSLYIQLENGNYLGAFVAEREKETDPVKLAAGLLVKTRIRTVEYPDPDEFDLCLLEYDIDPNTLARDWNSNATRLACREDESHGTRSSEFLYCQPCETSICDSNGRGYCVLDGGGAETCACSAGSTRMASDSEVCSDVSGGCIGDPSAFCRIDDGCDADPCGANSLCVDTDQAYTCTCRQGFVSPTNDGKSCVKGDVCGNIGAKNILSTFNETVMYCVDPTDSTDPVFGCIDGYTANITNATGSTVTVGMNTYVDKTLSSCIPINECIVDPPCGPNSICTDMDPTTNGTAKYSCECEAGHISMNGDGSECRLPYEDGSCEYPMTNFMESFWYETTATRVAENIPESEFGGSEGVAAALKARSLGEGWSSVQVVDQYGYRSEVGVGTDKVSGVSGRGVSFTYPIYEAESGRPVVTPGSQVSAGTSTLTLVGVIGADLSIPLLEDTLEGFRVGRTGVVYIAEASEATQTFSVFATGESTSKSNRYIRTSTSSYFRRRVASKGVAMFSDVREPFNCSAYDEDENSQELFSEDELNEVSRATIIEISGVKMIFSSRNVSLLYADSTPDRVKVENSWVIVAAFPAQDYFSAVTESEKKTLALGSVALFLGFILLYFTYGLIPNMKRLRAEVLEDVRKEHEGEQEDAFTLKDAVEMTRLRRKKRKKRKEAASRQNLISGSVDGESDDESTVGLRRDPSSQSFGRSGTFTSVASAQSVATDVTINEEDEPDRKSNGDGSSNNLALDRKETLREEFGEKWENHTYKYAVVFTAVLIILIFSSIAFVWSSSSSDAVELIGDDLVTETRDHIEFSTNTFLDTPVLVNELNVKAYEQFQESPQVGPFRTMLNQSTATFPGNEPGFPEIVFLPPTLLSGGAYVYDAYFTSIFNAFRSDDGSYPLNSIYLGFQNGDFVGARVNPSDRTEIQIVALDSTTSNSYTTYAVNTETGIRDLSQVIEVLEPGTYDPRTRVWYTTAVEDYNTTNTVRPTWTNVYLFSGTEKIGLTTMLPVTSSTGDLNAVFAIDVNLEFLSEFLEDAQHFSSCSSRFFIMQRTGELTASSTLEVTRSFANAVDDAGVKVVFLLNATDANDEDLSTTAAFLTKRSGGLAAVDEDQIVERPLQSPITGVSPIQRNSSSGLEELGMDWLIVTTLPFDVFLGQFENYSTLSFLLGVATIGIIAFLVTLSFREFEAKILEQQKVIKKVDKDDLEKHELAPGETEEEWEERSLVDLMREIRPTIVQACAYSWNRHNSEEFESWEPSTIEKIRDYAARTGIKHIRSGQKGRDILTLASLEERKSSIPRRSYKLYTNAAYQKFILSVIVTHIAIALFEPDTRAQLEEEGMNSLLWFIELCALSLETFDIILWFVIKVKWRDRRREKEEIRKHRETRARKGKHKDSFKIKLREKYGIHLDYNMWLDILYSFLLIIVWVDWYLKWSSSFSYQYFIPIRPFLIILRSPNLRRTTGNFLRTVYTAKDIFALFFLVIIIAAALGVVMFRKTLTNITSSDGLEASYTNYVRAITTTFVYVSTGDNYTDLVYDAYEVSPFFMIYFLTCTVFGMFFILAMVIGWFQVAFVTMARQRELRQKLHDRTGIVACFILLDTDGSEKLNWTELENYMVAVRPILGQDDEQLAKVFKKLKEAHTQNNKMTPEQREARLLEESQTLSMSGTFRLSDFQKTKSEEIGLSVGQFVRIVEKVKWDRKTYAKDVTKINKFRQILQIRVFEQRWYSTLLIVLTFTQVLLITLFGTIDSDDEIYVEWTLFGIYCVHTLDILTRRYAYGKKEYWYYGKFHRGAVNRYQQLSNRYDLTLLVIWLIGFAAAFIAAEGRMTFRGDNKTRLPLVFSIPILRTFSLVKRVRNLFFTLIQILPKFVDLFILLLIIFLVYGVVGVGMFSEKFSELLQDDAPPANFDSLSEALQTLFQMLVGEAWADIMYAGIRVTRTFTSAWYFISFICFATLLFVNIFIGLVLQAFSIYLDESEEEEKEAEKERKELEERITGLRKPPKLSTRSKSRHVISDSLKL